MKTDKIRLTAFAERAESPLFVFNCVHHPIQVVIFEKPVNYYIWYLKKTLKKGHLKRKISSVRFFVIFTKLSCLFLYKNINEQVHGEGQKVTRVICNGGIRFNEQIKHGVENYR